MRNTTLKIILTILILGTISFAQDRLELERTLRNLKLRWQATYDLAVKYNNQEALRLLQKAKISFYQAIQLIKEQEWERAKLKLIQADLQIKAASQLVIKRHEIRFRNDLDKIMRRAEQAVFQSRNEEARYFLNKAKAFRKKANGAYQNSEYLRSQEFYRIATFFAEKALELADRGTAIKQDKSTLEEYYKNIERLLQETMSNNLTGNNGEELLSKANEYLTRSKKIFKNGDVKQAFLYLQIAERLLYRAIDLRSGAKGTLSVNIQENLFSLRRYLDGIHQSLQNERNGKSRQFLIKAEQYYNAASRDYKNGNHEKARQKIFLSQRLGSRALQFSDNEEDTQLSRLDERLEEVQRLLQLQSQKLQDSDDQIARYLNEQARDYYQQAGQARELGRITQAYHRLQLSLRFINRAEAQLSSITTPTISSNDLQERYNRIQNTLKSMSFESDNRNMKAVFTKFIDQIGQLLEENNIKLAARLMEILETQVNDYLRTMVH